MQDSNTANQVDLIF